MPLKWSFLIIRIGEDRPIGPVSRLNVGRRNEDGAGMYNIVTPLARPIFRERLGWRISMGRSTIEEEQKEGADELFHVDRTGSNGELAN